MVTNSSKINFIGTKNCFVTLPNDIKRNAEGILAVKMESSTGIIYSSCMDNSLQRNCRFIEVNGLFGAKCGLQHGQEVVITVLPHVPKCSSVYIEPISSDDWEIIELNRTHLEDNILKQIRVVAENQIFPIWIKNSLCLFVKVVKIEPAFPCAILIENTEVNIDPFRCSNKKLNNLDGKHQTVQQIISKRLETSVDTEGAVYGNLTNGFLTKFICSLSNFQHQANKNNTENYEDQFRKETFYFNEVIPCRTLAIERFLKNNPNISGVTNEVFILDKYFRSKVKSIEIPGDIHSFLAIIKKLQIEERVDKQGKITKDQNVTKITVVRVNLLNADDLDCQIEMCFNDLILIPECLRLRLDADITSRVTLEVLKDFTPLVTHVKKMDIIPLFHIPKELTIEMIESAIQTYFESLLTSSKRYFLLNNNELIECFLKMGRKYFVIKFLENDIHQDTIQSENNICFLSLKSLSSLSLKVYVNESLQNFFLDNFFKNRLINCEVNDDDDDVDDESLQIIPVMFENCKTHLVKEVCKYLEFCCECYGSNEHQIFKQGGMLLTGPRGSGKTTFCQYLQKKLQNQAKTFYVKFVDCSEICGKSFNSLSQIFSNIFDELFLRRPSLLILDNLDSLCSSQSNEETETSSHALLHTQVAHMILLSMTKESYNKGFNLIFATSESVDKLHPIFLQRLFFTQLYKVAMFKNDCEKIKFMKKCLKNILNVFDCNNRPQDCTTLKMHGSKLDGYVAQDILTVAKQLVIQALSRGSKLNKIKITDDDLSSVLGKYTPLQVRHSNLSALPSVNFADVGALKDQKRSLTETLLWPTMYPHLFKNYPLPLRKGTLLYGAPGTGKTLLAMAAANECKLNLICIKGPELLNKFIGASEKAVRETFARAQSVRPCIIFFDELDSLAPRRGNDNTGVTDRVVNQLLAELDGVEQLEGVFILAASSRPDLIDPALLRPGRLDLQLFCKIPDEIERLEILTTLVKDMVLAENVNLKTLANMTINFTGADIKAVIYNAFLEAIQDVKELSDQCIPIINQHHFFMALKSTRPSLSLKDRNFYDQVFSLFNRNDVYKTVENMKQKTTLA